MSAPTTSSTQPAVAANAGQAGKGQGVQKKLLYGLLLLALIAAPLAGAYPVFVLKVLCFALFACAFNLLIGYTGLLSFGHAAFFGGAGYAAGHAMKAWGVTPGPAAACNSSCSSGKWVQARTMTSMASPPAWSVSPSSARAIVAGSTGAPRSLPSATRSASRWRCCRSSGSRSRRDRTAVPSSGRLSSAGTCTCPRAPGRPPSSDNP